MNSQTKSARTFLSFLTGITLRLCQCISKDSPTTWILVGNMEQVCVGKYIPLNMQYTLHPIKGSHHTFTRNICKAVLPRHPSFLLLTVNHFVEFSVHCEYLVLSEPNDGNTTGSVFLSAVEWLTLDGGPRGIMHPWFICWFRCYIYIYIVSLFTSFASPWPQGCNKLLLYWEQTCRITQFLY